jgi:hypothetical protein
LGAEEELPHESAHSATIYAFAVILPAVALFLAFWAWMFTDMTHNRRLLESAKSD